MYEGGYTQGRIQGDAMSVPPFDDLGLLPIGVHDTTFAEIEMALCWNQHRLELWASFRRFLQDRCGMLIAAKVPFWVDGSFARRKELPSDIDVVIDLSGHTDRNDLVSAVLLLRFLHDQIKAEYHVDLWSRHPNIPNDLTVFFQYAGDKCAIELQIEPKHPKGILRATS